MNEDEQSAPREQRQGLVAALELFGLCLFLVFLALLTAPGFVPWDQIAAASWLAPVLWHFEQVEQWHSGLAPGARIGLLVSIFAVLFYLAKGAPPKPRSRQLGSLAMLVFGSGVLVWLGPEMNDPMSSSFAPTRFDGFVVIMIWMTTETLAPSFWAALRKRLEV